MRIIIAAIALACAATSALALQHPLPAVPLDHGGDPHVQVAMFNPAEPVLLVGAVGRPITVTFAPTEHIKRINLDAGYLDESGKKIDPPWDGPDPGQMAQQPIGNILPLWPVRAGRSNAQVITGTEDGASRIYQFVLVALPPQPDDCTPVDGQEIDDCDDPRITSGLSFVYPVSAEVRKAAAPDPATAAAARAAIQERVAQQKLASEARLKTDIFYGIRNWKYLIKGKPEAVKELAPDQISDNTQVTGLLYLGNRKAPAIYVVEAGGVERQVSPVPDQDLLVLYETAKHWRLRKDTQVVDIYNAGYDPIGANPDTGTISPDVIRVTRAGK